MRELCEEKGVEFVLMKAPSISPHWYDEWDVQMEEYAKENGLKYINFIPLQEEIGLDMTKDTYDAGLHLNVWGAEKFSIYFGKWLKENTELPDRRRDEKYSSVWEEKTKRYEKEKKQQTDELEKYGKLVSFGANAVKG